MIIDFQSNGGGGGGKIETTLTATENGTYTPESGYVYKKAVVNVQGKEEVSLSVTENGSYEPAEGKVYSAVTVDVPTYDNCLRLEVSGDTIDSFIGITNVTKVITPTGLTSLPDGFFGNCAELVTLIVSEGVESIGTQLAGNDESLKLIDLPSTLTDVVNNSFQYVLGTPDVIIRATTPPTAPRLAILNTIGALYVPDESVSLYKETQPWMRIEENIYPLSEYPTE